jgi:hypothetical protein
MAPRIWLASVALAIGLIANSALAIEKIEDTFSTGARSENGFSSPTDTITKGVMGQRIYYWAKWRNEDPSHQTKWRCVITFHEEDDAVYDNDWVTPDDRPEGYTYCGLDTGVAGLFEGSYRFIIYADGKKFSEGTINIQKTFLSRLHLSPLNLALVAVALVVLGFSWLRKKKEE